MARVTLKHVRGEESLYRRAEIFQQTSLSFHLPNADGGPTPAAPDRQDCNAAGNYRALFFTLAISTARDSDHPLKRERECERERGA